MYSLITELFIQLQQVDLPTVFRIYYYCDRLEDAIVADCIADYVFKPANISVSTLVQLWKCRDEKKNAWFDEIRILFNK